MKSHQDSVHVLLFNCEKCETKFTKNETLLTHIKDIHEKKVCFPCNKNTRENACINCEFFCCKQCINSVNPKETMVRAVKAGILQKEWKITEYICKPCFKERCDKKKMQK